MSTKKPRKTWSKDIKNTAQNIIEKTSTNSQNILIPAPEEGTNCTVLFPSRPSLTVDWSELKFAAMQHPTGKGNEVKQTSMDEKNTILQIPSHENDTNMLTPVNEKNTNAKSVAGTKSNEAIKNEKNVYLNSSANRLHYHYESNQRDSEAYKLEETKTEIELETYKSAEENISSTYDNHISFPSSLNPFVDASGDHILPHDECDEGNFSYDISFSNFESLPPKMEINLPTELCVNDSSIVVHNEDTSEALSNIVIRETLNNEFHNNDELKITSIAECDDKFNQELTIFIG